MPIARRGITALASPACPIVPAGSHSLLILSLVHLPLAPSNLIPDRIEGGLHRRPSALPSRARSIRNSLVYRGNCPRHDQHDAKYAASRKGKQNPSHGRLAVFARSIQLDSTP